MDSTQLMEKVAELAPDKYDFLVKTAAEVRTSPFNEEIVAELDGIMKKAGVNWQGLQSSVGRGAAGLGMGIATTALGGIGLALAGDMYDAARRGITKTRDYKRMMAANPDLKDKPAAEIQTIFSTLHRLNPDFAGDAYVAGSFVRDHSEMASGVRLEGLKQLVDARKGLTESRRLPSPKFTELPDNEMRGLQKGKLQGEIAGMAGKQQYGGSR